MYLVEQLTRIRRVDGRECLWPYDTIYGDVEDALHLLDGRFCTRRPCPIDDDIRNGLVCNLVCTPRIPVAGFEDCEPLFVGNRLELFNRGIFAVELPEGADGDSFVGCPAAVERVVYKPAFPAKNEGLE